MDFASVWNRFGQPFRPDLPVDRNRNRADQIPILHYTAPKTGELTFKVFDYFPHCFPGGSRAVLAAGEFPQERRDIDGCHLLGDWRVGVGDWGSGLSNPYPPIPSLSVTRSSPGSPWSRAEVTWAGPAAARRLRYRSRWRWQPAEEQSALRPHRAHPPDDRGSGLQP